MSGRCALGEVCQVQRNWDRVSHGLGDLAISRGWWPEDGSKLDFEAAICSIESTAAASQQRLHQMTQCLEYQSGGLNVSLVRSLLGQHCLASMDEEPSSEATLASMIVQIPVGSDRPQVWYSFGTPHLDLYFPLTFEAPLPREFTAHAADANSIWNRMSRLADIASHGPWQGQAVREVLSGLRAAL